MIAQANMVFATLTDVESASLRGFIVLGGLAVTNGMTKMLSDNKFIDSYSEKTGVRSKELAIVTGLMGGLFSLGNAIPLCNEFGWKIPAFYAAFKIANSYFVNKYIFANIPNVGEHLAGAQILKTRDILKSSNSLFYKMRLTVALAEVRNVLRDNPQAQCDTLYETLSANTKAMMSKEDWTAFSQGCQSGKDLSARLASHDDQIKEESDINADAVKAVTFATAAVAYCVYEPIKIILNNAFDYPNCMINFSGKYIDRFTSKLIQ